MPILEKQFCFDQLVFPISPGLLGVFDLLQPHSESHPRPPPLSPPTPFTPSCPSSSSAYSAPPLRYHSPFPPPCPDPSAHSPPRLRHDMSTSNRLEWVRVLLCSLLLSLTSPLTSVSLCIGAFGLVWCAVSSHNPHNSPHL